MGKPIINIYEENPSPFFMRTITEKDIEYIRILKNSNKNSFFFNKIIDPEKQYRWFVNFSQRTDDHMFVVIFDGRYAGCLGTRFLNDHNDIYNVMSGDPDIKGKGIMSMAINAIIKVNCLIYPQFPNRVKVLLSNPAITWYKRNGFETIKSFKDYIWMEYREVIKPHKFSVSISSV